MHYFPPFGFIVLATLRLGIFSGHVLTMHLLMKVLNYLPAVVLCFPHLLTPGQT